MDSLIGITGENFVLLAADTGAARSIVVMKQDEDKIMELDKHKLLGGAGENGDRTQFSEYIQKNMQLYELRNGYPLDTSSAAHFIRGELAEALRQNPYNVNLLLAGYDKNGPALYFMDYLASMHKMNYAVHGYAGYFLFSLLDRTYRTGLKLDEALELLKLCLQELATRFIINNPSFIVKIVDANGIKIISL